MENQESNRTLDKVAIIRMQSIIVGCGTAASEQINVKCIKKSLTFRL